MMFALSVANPFRRHRQWRSVFLLFGNVRLEDDHRRHLLVCRRVLRRYSATRRQWCWTSAKSPHVPTQF
jgi:hypothetical protein